ncbi:hypothetical protein QAD02_005669 [Eretmocerus hayati]|uniref:Uncharacterized protein n=1 Tax=Eretmocerus hayati TaxID=131215 RepID=A0ACC2NTF6_9HYME|nr:hypothetical protein QAD02_005669 [Eretmocerus hayati]
MCEHNYLWELQDPAATRKALPNIEGALIRRSWTEDVERALNSSYCPMYKEIKNLQPSPSYEDYITQNLPLAQVRIFAGCRLSGNLLLRLCANNTSSRIDQTKKCFLCNFNVNESLLHIINECPAYTGLRSKYLDDSSIQTILSCSRTANLKNLHSFTTGMLKTRSYFLYDCYT